MRTFFLLGSLLLCACKETPPPGPPAPPPAASALPRPPTGLERPPTSGGLPSELKPPGR